MTYAGQWVWIQSVLGKSCKVFNSKNELIAAPERRFDDIYRPIHPEHITLNDTYLEKKTAIRTGSLKTFVTLFGEVGQRFAESLRPILKEGFYLHLHDILKFCDFYEIATIQSILEHEYTHRHDRSVQLRIAQAKFPFTKTIDDFDFSFQPGLNQQQVIQLSGLSFIDHHENVIFVKACMARLRIVFISAQNLIKELVSAKNNKISYLIAFCSIPDSIS